MGKDSDHYFIYDDGRWRKDTPIEETPPDTTSAQEHWGTTVCKCYLEWLEKLEDWRIETIMPFINGLAIGLGVSIGEVVQPLRIALTGTASSPPIDQTLWLIGREEAIVRIKKAMKELG